MRTRKFGRILTTTVIAALLLTVGAPLVAASHDTPCSASAPSLGGVGLSSVARSGLRSGHLTDSGDEDWYQIHLRSGDRISVEEIRPVGINNFHAGLYEIDEGWQGEECDQLTTLGPTGDVVRETKTYWLKITPFWSSGGDYTFYWSQVTSL